MTHKTFPLFSRYKLRIFCEKRLNKSKTIDIPKQGMLFYKGKQIRVSQNGRTEVMGYGRIFTMWIFRYNRESSVSSWEPPGQVKPLSWIFWAAWIPWRRAKSFWMMHEVNIDMISFDVHVRAVSYLLSILLTFAFTWVVNRIMAGKLDRINMAESLKSVD